MKKEGILIVKTKEIEIQLSPQHLNTSTSPDITEGPEKSSKAYGEDASLFWSSPGENMELEQ